MEKSLSEYINESDMLVIGIGSEWDWIKKGIKKDRDTRNCVNTATKKKTPGFGP